MDTLLLENDTEEEVIEETEPTYESESEIIKAFNDGDICKERAFYLLSEISSATFVFTIDREEIVDEEDAYFCEDSEHYFSRDDDFIEVITSYRRGVRNSVRINTEYSNRSYFYCENTHNNYDSDNFNEIYVEGETVCEEACSASIYYWESDNEYHWEEEEEEDNGSDLTDYHDTDRPRSWDTASGYGLELEVYCDDPVELANELPSGFIGEKDGSIDETYGIEIIGHPIKFSDYYLGNPWKTLFTKFDDHGVTAPSIKYGLHINVSKSLFGSPLHMSKFIVMMNKLEEMGKHVAKRREIYNGRYYTGKRIGKDTLKTGKFEPVNTKDHCLEVRIFKATNEYSHLMICLEYTEAVKEITRNCSILDIGNEQKAEKMMGAFLKSNPKFKNLKKYIEEKFILTA